MIGRHGLRFPPGTIIWTFFLAWVLASMTMLDSGGRVIGAFYRFLLELAPGIFAVYAYNARKTLSVRAIVGTMWGFLASTTIGGFIAMAAPTLRFKTLMYYLVPRALHSNDFVKEFTRRATTQWNPSSAYPLRPAPVGSLHLLQHLRQRLLADLPAGSRLRLRAVARALQVAFPRGRRVRPVGDSGRRDPQSWHVHRPDRRRRVGGFPASARGPGARCSASSRPSQRASSLRVAGDPGLEPLLERVAASSSGMAPRTTWKGSTSSSSPRSSGSARRVPRRRRGCPPWAEGQFWTVIFSYGLVGLLLFLAFFVRMFPRIWRAKDVYGSILGGIILATLVEQFYYGMNTGLMISVVAVSLLSRHLEEESDPSASRHRSGAGCADGGQRRRERCAPRVRREWQSPAANDGAFATQMLERLNRSGRRGRRNRQASSSLPPSQTENR